MAAAQVQIPADWLEGFCRRWKVRELSLFGSVLRDDFGPASDIDVLVSFEQNDGWRFEDLMTMKDELARFLERNVDLVEKEALTNPFRRHRILNSRQIIYAAPGSRDQMPISRDLTPLPRQWPSPQTEREGDL